jgi:hypothetical protein
LLGLNGIRLWLSLVLVGLGLGGCSVGTDVLTYLTPGKVPDTPKLEPGVFPTRYKADVATLMRTELSNPVAQAFIGDPTLKPIAGVPHYVTCVRYNLRGSHNRDAGNHMNYVIFLGGFINQFLPGTPELCSGLNYQRYPEIETKVP